MTRAVTLAVETGGTKIIARLTEGNRVLSENRWPTTTPDAAQKSIVDWAASHFPRRSVVGAIGIAAFGPLILDATDPRFGEQLETTKPGWTGSNLGKALGDVFGAPFAIDTDVNAAALAEHRAGAGRGYESIAYLTIGTGIGAGLSGPSGTLRGAVHPEVGHLLLNRLPDDRAPSSCPYHADCAEGLAAGPAVRARLGERELADEPEIAALVSHYIAKLCAAILLFWSPHRIIIGGGVATTPGMIERIQRAFSDGLGSYGLGAASRSPEFITKALLTNAGLDGAALMAHFLSGPGRVGSVTRAAVA